MTTINIFLRLNLILIGIHRPTIPLLLPLEPPLILTSHLTSGSKTPRFGKQCLPIKLIDRLSINSYVLSIVITVFYGILRCFTLFYSI
jgi:hypothetical protein